MDPKQAELIEKYQESKLSELSHNVNNSDDEGDLLDILQELEEEDDSTILYREQRLEQLKKEFKNIDRAAADMGDSLGTIDFVEDEKTLMDLVTKGDVVVVHFYQPSFPKCKIMNETLSTLAEKHMKIKVLAITAENALFLVTKLKIKVLPFVLVYKRGQELTRIVGFEGLGSDPSKISWSAFEQKLLNVGAIDRKTINTSQYQSKIIRGKEEDSDDDWY